MNVTGKNGVVVGGAGGIGLETCRQLLQKGIKSLIIVDILEQPNATINELINEYNNNNNKSTIIVYFKMDVTDKINVENVFKEFSKILNNQSIDLVLYCAGIFDERLIEKTIMVNYLGLVNVTLTAMKYMKSSSNGGGLISALSSIAGLQTSFSYPVYAGTKQAVISFMRSLADDIIHKLYGIKFITICPGAALTPLLADITDKVQFPETAADTVKVFREFNTISAMEMAKLIVEILEIGENGSVWIAEDNRIKEVQFSALYP